MTTRPRIRAIAQRARQALLASRDRLLPAAGRVLRDPRLRGEIGWVVLNKGAEFALLFALLKVLSNRIGKAGYGEYNLAETAVLLLTSIALMPVHESYLRDYHGAGDRDERRAAGILLLRWYAAVTLAGVLVSALLTTRLAEWFDVGRWTPLAAGLLFLFERWRFLGQDLLNIQRRRRAWALYNLSYSLCLIAAISLAVHLGPATATTALLAYAGTSALFSVLVTGPMVRDILRAPRSRPSGLSRLVLVFGVPYAALLIFQWVQGFSDRYLVKALLDAESVGLYVAAYQVCGIPFALVLRISHNLLTPIAYQRGRDIANPAQLWAADRLLLAGIAVQVCLGALLLVFYAWLGPRLLVLLTNDGFVLPATTLVILAAARFAQSLSQATQPIFAVHHRLATMLWFRLFGAIATVLISWRMIAAYGIFGAAAGTCISLCAYAAVLVFAPRGCWWLVRDARHRALQR